MYLQETLMIQFGIQYGGHLKIENFKYAFGFVSMIVEDQWKKED